MITCGYTSGYLWYLSFAGNPWKPATCGFLTHGSRWLWKKIFVNLGIGFGTQIPVGKGPGNLQVHLCSALVSPGPNPFFLMTLSQGFKAILKPSHLTKYCSFQLITWLSKISSTIYSSSPSTIPRGGMDDILKWNLVGLEWVWQHQRPDVDSSWIREVLDDRCHCQPS